LFPLPPEVCNHEIFAVFCITGLDGLQEAAMFCLCLGTTRHLIGQQRRVIVVERCSPGFCCLSFFCIDKIFTVQLYAQGLEIASYLILCFSKKKGAGASLPSMPIASCLPVTALIGAFFIWRFFFKPRVSGRNPM
jgi:hypothetical protein